MQKNICKNMQKYARKLYANICNLYANICMPKYMQKYAKQNMQ